MDFHGLVEHPERTHNRHTKGLIRRLKAYRSFLQEHPDFETRIVEIGDGIAISRRRKHV
jgi:predicted O-methyltransferase YrrM